MRPLSELNEYRQRGFEAHFGLFPGDDHDDHVGCFLVKTSGHPKPLKVIVYRFREGQEVSDSNPAWNHVSVSLPNRCPTWTEMDHIKRLFFYPHEVAMQLHVAEVDHVSNHDYCLHIWQPVGIEIPTPPAIMVGIKNAGTMSTHNR